MFTPALDVADLPIYPGSMWLDAVGRGWREMAMRGYKLGPLKVPARIPHHVLVLYKGGATTMHRHIRNALVTDRIIPGDISVKSCHTMGGWSWDDPLDVVHIYVHPQVLQRTAVEIYGQAITRVELRDCVKTRDDEVSSLMRSLEREATAPGPGTELMIQLLQRQLAIALVRNHGDVVQAPQSRATFDAAQQRFIGEYIAARLHENLTVARLARSVKLSEDHFSRLFRATFDESPHRYVMRVRCEAARQMLRDPSRSLADIACQTGFADQSHLTRCFRREFGEAPSALRRLRPLM